MQKRLPDRSAIVQVYAVIAVLFAGWTITAFLWKISAWLLLLNLAEVLTIFSYAMAVNFLESLILLLGLLAASVLLPARLLRDDFVVRGTILSLGIVGALMAFIGFHMQFGLESRLVLVAAPLVVLTTMGLLLAFSSRWERVRSLVLWLSDRVTVFLLILLPLFALVSLYILVRNIA
jgi:hypothetical protein